MGLLQMEFRRGQCRAGFPSKNQSCVKAPPRRRYLTQISVLQINPPSTQPAMLALFPVIFALPL